MTNYVFFKNENLLSEELHLKLIKAYLKSSNISKAVRHLARIEYKQLFSSQLWYKNVIDAVENSLISSTKSQNETTIQILQSTVVNLLTRQLKILLQNTNEINSAVEIIFKFVLT